MATSGLQWPVDGGRISAPFSSDTGSISIAASAGKAVKSASDGLVIVAVGDTVQVGFGLYTLIYNGLQNLTVTGNQSITAGTQLGEAAGDSIRLTVLQAIDPTSVLPEQPAAPVEPPPVSAPEPETSAGGKLYVSPTTKNVRLRGQPVVNTTNILGQYDPTDILEVIEPAEDARKKLGVKNQWINVRTLYGIAGYSAADYLKEYTGAIPEIMPNPYGASNITGMNLDMHNPLGHPSADRLKGIGWIRVKFNVSYNPDATDDSHRYGNTDIQATFNRVKPFLEPYTRAGIKVLMVFTHQLYGEGAGYNWDSIDTGGWNNLIPKYADFAKRTAALFAGRGLVHAYQIWNEQDTPRGKGRAAVPIDSKNYANMLTQTIRAIRSVDSKTLIITGGHVTGSDTGSQYAKETLAAMPADVRPDGIAAHPYGLGPKGHKFSNNGLLEDAIKKFGAVMPDKPIWFTEWGVLGFQGHNEVAPDVTSYASGFIKIIKNQYSGKVAAAMWYAWADGMDDGYGLVDKDDKPKTPLHDTFKAL